MNSPVRKMVPALSARYNISARKSTLDMGFDNDGLEVDSDDFPRNRLKFLDHLGQGKFGKVMKAEALSISRTGTWETVAVKMWKDTATDGQKADFYHELMIMKKITHHPNVVKFLGTSKPQDSDSVLMIMEYVPRGDLLNFLRQKRTYYNQIHQMKISAAEPPRMEDVELGELASDDQKGSSRCIVSAPQTPFHTEFTPKDLLSYSYQIAKGMSHIASLKIVHRDVAARNILIGQNNICKVSDFGLARDVDDTDEYQQTTKGPLPIRWMSIEALRDNVHSTKSDVWSFGVCLWEIATFGASPYPGKSAKMAMDAILYGEHLECPTHCKQEFYTVMESCWARNPRDRPSFTDLVNTLEELLEAEGDYMMLDCFDGDIYYVIDGGASGERL